MRRPATRIATGITLALMAACTAQVADTAPGRPNISATPTVVPLVAGRVAEEFEPSEMDGIALEPDSAPVGVKVGVGQIHDHRAIVV